jgi:hypothetical protein
LLSCLKFPAFHDAKNSPLWEFHPTKERKFAPLQTTDMTTTEEDQVQISEDRQPVYLVLGIWRCLEIVFNSKKDGLDVNALEVVLNRTKSMAKHHLGDWW